MITITHTIKSYAKINLNLNIVSKRKINNLHQIESLVALIDLADEIKISEIRSKKHKVIFRGKYSKGIPKFNTITHLLALLEKEKIIKKKYQILVKKNIPQKSGMGGGSMNASNILKYLIKKNFLSLSNKEVNQTAYKVGSDVILGLEKKNSILFKNGGIGRINKKLNFYVLIVMPNFGCSTKDIFLGVKKFTKPMYFNLNKKYFNIRNLIKSDNSLEKVVFKKYPKTKKMKLFLLKLPGVIFARMTGSGSAFVAYFQYEKFAKNAAKIFEKKYKGYWYTVSKTI